MDRLLSVRDYFTQTRNIREARNLGEIFGRDCYWGSLRGSRLLRRKSHDSLSLIGSLYTRELQRRNLVHRNRRGIATAGCRQSGRPYDGRGVHEERSRRRLRRRRGARSASFTGIATKVLFGNVVHDVVVHANRPRFLIMCPVLMTSLTSTSTISPSFSRFSLPALFSLLRLSMSSLLSSASASASSPSSWSQLTLDKAASRSACRSHNASWSGATRCLTATDHAESRARARDRVSSSSRRRDHDARRFSPRARHMAPRSRQTRAVLFISLSCLFCGLFSRLSHSLSLYLFYWRTRGIRGYVDAGMVTTVKRPK